MRTTPRLVATWIGGVVVATALVAISSPLFVRSYLPQQLDSLRGVWTLPAGHPYRWRREGYATTHIGPHGMPGKADLSTATPLRRVALWGDSQAEGVAVADDQKIFAQAQRIAGAATEFFPLARSGDDARHWMAQMPRVENHWGIDTHVILVAELSDLAAAAIDTPISDIDDAVLRRQSEIAADVPDFVIHAVRRLIRTADDQPRRLRFAVGPIATSPPVSVDATPTGESVDWGRVVQRIASSGDATVVLVYAPVLPAISGGAVTWDDPQQPEFDRLAQAADRAGIPLIDARDALRDAARRGQWPHGFHQGRFGSGHLNATGNHLIARLIVAAIESLTVSSR